MLTPAEMERRVLEELAGAATVHVSPALQSAVRLPSTVELVSDLETPVDLALVAAHALLVDGRAHGDPVPTNARRVVAVIDALQVGTLTAPAPEGGAGPGGPPVDRVITPMAVLDRVARGFRVREVAEGVSAADVQRAVDVPLVAGPDLAVIGRVPGRD